MAESPARAPFEPCRSACPECGRVLPATVSEEGGALFLTRDCPEHGRRKTLWRKDAAFYRELTRIVRPAATHDLPHLVDVNDAKIIAVDLTEDCNLRCPVCFTAAGSRPTTQIDADYLLSRLAALPHRRLEIALLGGEPTLHPDLPRLVREILRMGFRLKLLTNGLRFEDPGYAAQLREAGLQWVIYQFDGLDRATYLTLRGRDLLDLKLRVLQTMTDLKFKVCLAVMVVAGVNDGQLGELLRFGFRQPAVHHIALLPGSPLGRNTMDLSAEHLHAEDVMELIAAQTDAHITRADWLRTARFMQRVYRVTGNIDYRQRVCFFSMPLVGDADDFIPAVRLTRPWEWPRYAAYLSKAPFILRNFSAIDQGRMPGHFLYLSIEKMYGAGAMHIEDNGQCNTLYLTPDGFVPSCLYNALYRRERPSCVAC